MAPQAPLDERISVGVLFVGGGPAGLAGAIRLAQLLQEQPELAASFGDVEAAIAVVDKGSTPGAHELSGAVVVPGPLQELLPGVDLVAELGSYGEVDSEAVYVLTAGSKLRIPTPPPFHNKGNHVFSLSKLTRKLAEKAEELGIMVLPETAADRLLVEDGVVVGVRTGDKGRGRAGETLSNFEPGMELHAQATVLSDGTQGHLSMALIEHFHLANDTPQAWELGVKEVWKVAKPLTHDVIHTMGWPLRTGAKWKEFGGSFIYRMGDDHICIGLVTGLDTTDASFSVHDLLQTLKLHPFVRGLLEGGERVGWGAKTIPAGGYFALPTSLQVPGALLAGDAAGMVNIPKLKGVHLAMRAGMLAAESIVQALAAGKSLHGVDTLTNYDAAFIESHIRKDMYRSRNMRQPFQHGFFVGGAIAGMMDATGGKFPGGQWSSHRDSDAPVSDSGRTYPAPDGKLTFDKLSSVFLSGNKTRDDQPNHVRVQQRVPRSVAKSWVSMCPAAVYELESWDGPDDEVVSVTLAPSNCVHCGAITAKGGRLTPPEGGSGPEYQLM